MPYTEKCTSKIKSSHAFLLCLCVIILTVLLARSLPLEKYRVFIELFVVLFVGGLLYLLYRYTLTVHTYTLDGTTFSVSRGEGVHQKTVAVLTGDMIRCIARSSYEGARVPKGDFISVNACSSLRGKSRAWCIWCVVSPYEKYKLFFEPSDVLVQKLSAAFPNLIVMDASVSDSSPASN